MTITYIKNSEILKLNLPYYYNCRFVDKLKKKLKKIVTLLPRMVN